MNKQRFPTNPDDAQFEHLVLAARRNQWSSTEVAELAEQLAASGERLTWRSDTTADVASTGGPGSLSTLLAPLFLRAYGATVVKLAVPGRPAGAIDALGTIRGYRVHSSSEEVRAAIDRCGFAHFLADDRFAPLDASLFSYRRRVGAVAIPALAAASLLAKKLAVGVRHVGLDVRVGEHGNFGADLSDARANALTFCDAARLAGVHATAFLSAGRPPTQPWIGRGESLIALAAALELCELPNVSSWLGNHVADCQRMAQETVALLLPEPLTKLASRELVAVLRLHLAAHNSSLDHFQMRVDEVLAAQHEMVESRETGTLNVDIALLRDTLVAAQHDDTNQGFFRDPAGLELLVRPGATVVAGQPLARVRVEDTSLTADLTERVRSAFRVHSDTSPEEGASGRFEMEVVRG